MFSSRRLIAAVIATACGFACRFEPVRLPRVDAVAHADGYSEGDASAAGDSVGGDIAASGDAGPSGPMMELVQACEAEFCHLWPGPASNGIVDLHIFEGELWAVTGTRYALRWNGSSWQPHAAPMQTELVTLWQRQGALNAMGRDGQWATWDGGQWLAQTPTFIPGLNGVVRACSLGNGDTWATTPITSAHLVDADWLSEPSASWVEDLSCSVDSVFRLTSVAIEMREDGAWQKTFDVNQGVSLVASSPTRLWFATDFSSVDVLDGVPGETAIGRRVSAFDASEGWQVLAGPTGLVATVDESGLSTMTPTSADLTAVTLRDDSFAWIGGAYGLLIRHTPSATALLMSAAEAQYLEGYSDGAGEVWIVGSDGRGRSVAERWGGTTWRSTAIPMVGPILHVSGAAGAVYAATDETLLRWTAGAWTTEPVGTVPIADIWVAGPDDVWILTADSLVLRWNGSVLSDTAVEPPSPATRHASIWGTSADNLWVAQTSVNATVVIHWNGANWTRQTLLPSRRRVVDFDGLADDDVWALAYEGGAFHWDGQVWTYTSANVGTGTSIACMGSMTCVASGNDGEISVSDGMSFSRLDIPQTTGWTDLIPFEAGALAIHGAKVWLLP